MPRCSRFAAFHAGELGGVKPGAVGEVFLREFGACAFGSEICADEAQDVPLGCDRGQSAAPHRPATETRL